MTTPNVPHRIEITVEVPGTPEQVWEAIATAQGLSAWFLPTELEEREGGAVCFHMGEEMSSEGTITGWEPPHRLVYEEPGWAELAGADGRSVTPLASEFLVEARSGGTCVVRVVSSAFGTGAEWERELFDQMEQGWRPFFAHLRLYLTHFPGQHATTLPVESTFPGRAGDVWSAMRRNLGVAGAGGRLEARGLSGPVENVGEHTLLWRVTEPLPGFVAFYASRMDDTTVMAGITAYLFSPDAPDFVVREQASWENWLRELVSSAAARAS